MNNIRLYAILILFILSNRLYAVGDSCSTAIALTECVTFSTGNATATTGSDDNYATGEICALSIDNSMWFTFSASSSGPFTLSLTNIIGFGSTQLEAGVFTGTCASLTYVNCNAGSGNFSLSFNATAGTAYTIIIDGVAGSPVSYDLRVCPGCDAIASFSATPITGPYPLTVAFTNASLSGSFFNWDFGIPGENYEGTNALYTYAEPGKFIAVLSAFNGVCTDTQTVLINVTGASSLTIPNVFTPNGDDINDVFKPVTKGITSMHGRVFNRWGDIVGEWEGVNGYWDGFTVMAGLEATAGTYFYEIIAEGYDGTQYEENGKVQLFR